MLIIGHNHHHLAATATWNHAGTTSLPETTLEPHWNYETWKHPGTTLDKPIWNLPGTALAKTLSGTTLEQVQQKQVCHGSYVCIGACIYLYILALALVIVRVLLVPVLRVVLVIRSTSTTSSVADSTSSARNTQ